MVRVRRIPASRANASMIRKPTPTTASRKSGQRAVSGELLLGKLAKRRALSVEGRVLMVARMVDWAPVFQSVTGTKARLEIWMSNQPVRGGRGCELARPPA